MNQAPRALLPLTESTAAFDTQALRQMEEREGSLDQHPSILMERAGLAAARLARALAPGAGHIAVLCGPGNNGGDGWVAAWHLHRWGVPVTAHEIGGPGRTPDQRGAQARARAAGVPITSQLEPDARSGLVLDALLGIGLHSEPRGELAACLRVLARHPARRLAIDLPSGLDSDTGQDWGAVPCTDTLTFLAAKPGLFTGAGRSLAGRIWLDSLGTQTQDGTARARLAGSKLLAEWRALSPRARSSHATHKGHQGDLWVLGGAMPGAALLAARAGLLAGAGRVYLTGRTAEDSWQPELLLRPPSDTAPPEGVTVVAGCGWGPGKEQSLRALLASNNPVVLDADAINALAAEPELRTQLQQRSTRGAATILTPHPLEAARLLRLSVAELQANRLHHAQALAEHLTCTVLLKGSGSVTASPARTPWINTTGHGALASAGTGDVLAGWLGGLWAQAPAAEPHELTALAAAWHGRAAELLPEGSAPMPASQLVQHMHALHP